MLRGSCLCQGVRYAIEGAPRYAFICTCPACMKLSAGARFAGFTVMPDQVTIEGALAAYVHEGGSGHPARRFFCEQCFSYVYSVPDVLGTMNFSIGTLDDPSAVAPQIAIFTRSRAAWDATGPEIRCFEALPPAPP